MKSGYDRQFGPGPVVASSVPEYRFGAEPIGTASGFWNRYSRLAEVLNARLPGFRLRLESAQNDPAYRGKLERGDLDIALVGPHCVLAAEKYGYSVFARGGIPDRIRGLVVVKRDSVFRSVRQLRGRVVSFGSPDSLAGTMLVQMWFRSAGLRLRRAQILETGSDESALLALYLGASEAAGISQSAWEEFSTTHAEYAASLVPKWQTEDLSGPAAMAHSRVPTAVVRQLARSLKELVTTSEGLAAIRRAGFSTFADAEPGSYDDIWEFLNAYARAFPQSPGRGVSQ